MSTAMAFLTPRTKVPALSIVSDLVTVVAPVIVATLKVREDHGLALGAFPSDIESVAITFNLTRVYTQYISQHLSWSYSRRPHQS